MAERFDLSTEGEWSVLQEDLGEELPAAVPGCIHTDLLAAGRIPDPFHRAQEQDVQWVSRTAWTYRCTFPAPDGFSAPELVAEGLDTLAEVRLNGTLLGTTDNMFRAYAWQLGRALQPGENVLEVRFAPALLHGQARQRERWMPSWNDDVWEPTGAPWLRKEQSNFGWDWGPRLVTCGIWKPIYLRDAAPARIAGFAHRQNHQDGRVRLECTVDVHVGDESDALRVEAALTPSADPAEEAAYVAEAVAPVTGGVARFTLEIDNPRLWWPNGLGEAFEYQLVLQLLDEGDNALEVAGHWVGLRTVHLVREPDEWGESFRFEVNGVPTFAKGANWIPPEVWPATPDRAATFERLVRAAADANMNMLRVWGGGLYEDDDFYEACDRLGILVWQDFAFACAGYPFDDHKFVDSFLEEARQNLGRLRNHPCLALLCGNNEMEQGLVGEEWTHTTMPWAEYSKVFDHLLPELCAELAPDVDYWPGSPHTPPPGDRKNFNDPERGDAHLWAVWHGREPFEWYRSSHHRFCSEFGFQSLPHPATMESFTEPQDRNLTSYVMEHHQRSPVGNGLLLHYLASWFRIPTSWQNTVWLTQIVQAMSISYAVEHWRRRWPRCAGALYWQLNDCWPVASWSSIDYHGHWKALHYAARRFFAPQMVTLLEKKEDHSVEVWLHNDRPEPAEGRLRMMITDLQGRRLWEQDRRAALLPLRAHRADVIPAAAALAEQGPRGVLVWAQLQVDGEAAGPWSLATFARPKHLELPDPALALRSSRDPVAGEIVVTSQKPALFAWLQSPGDPKAFGDNFFHLPGGGEIHRVAYEPDPGMQQRTIELRSLVDTYG